MTHKHSPPLTEPIITRHLVAVHGLSPVSVYQLTYFRRLVAHLRAHGKAAS